MVQYLRGRGILLLASASHLFIEERKEVSISASVSLLLCPLQLTPVCRAARWHLEVDEAWAGAQGFLAQTTWPFGSGLGFMRQRGLSLSD